VCVNLIGTVWSFRVQSSGASSGGRLAEKRAFAAREGCPANARLRHLSQYQRKKARPAMKSKALCFLFMLCISFLITVQNSQAGEVSIATEALNSFLKKRGDGAVSQSEKCPKTSDNIWYAIDYKIVPINDSSSAMTVFVMLCPQGNYSDEYLIVIENGKGRVVANDLIGVSKFMSSSMWVQGNTIYLEGSKWLTNDAHCCPSKEGTLEYNIKTNQHRFKLRDAKK
jgi:hypothetical protein